MVVPALRPPQPISSASNLPVESEVPKFLIGRTVVILLSSLIFYFGIVGLKSGEIRSRGIKFNRSANPLGYWLTVIINLVGPAAIIYLMLTR